MRKTNTFAAVSQPPEHRMVTLGLFYERSMTMEHILITYKMSRPGEIAESCIVLPMEREAAEDILEYQEDSQLVTEDGDTYDGQIAVILDRLAEIQGYDYAVFVMAERGEPL